MLYSDWLKIRTQNQVNILSPKLIWSGEDVNLVPNKFIPNLKNPKNFVAQSYPTPSSHSNLTNPHPYYIFLRFLHPPFPNPPPLHHHLPYHRHLIYTSFSPHPPVSTSPYLGV